MQDLTPSAACNIQRPVKAKPPGTRDQRQAATSHACTIRPMLSAAASYTASLSVGCA
jgi:hypothetical protein